MSRIRLAAQLRRIADQAGDDADQLVRGLIQVKEIFGDDLRHNEAFVSSVTAHVKSLFAHGARITVQNLNAAVS